MTARKVSRVDWRNLGLWILQVLIGLMFITVGVPKILGQPEMVAVFDAIGLGHWLRYYTGVLEVAGGLLLQQRSLAALGALLLGKVMTGAIASHLFLIGGNMAAPLLLLILLVVVAAGRRGETVAVAQRLSLTWRLPALGSKRG